MSEDYAKLVKEVTNLKSKITKWGNTDDTRTVSDIGKQLFTDEELAELKAKLYVSTDNLRYTSSFYAYSNNTMIGGCVTGYSGLKVNCKTLAKSHPEAHKARKAISKRVKEKLGGKVKVVLVGTNWLGSYNWQTRSHNANNTHVQLDVTIHGEVMPTLTELCARKEKARKLKTTIKAEINRLQNLVATLDQFAPDE